MNNSLIDTHKYNIGDITRDEDTVSMHSLSDEGGINDPLIVSSTQSTPSSSQFVCDIGKLLDLHIDLHQLSRDEKYQILKTEPNSDPSVYPRTRPYPTSTLRQFQPSWMNQYPWLHYSKFADGAFCRACVLFAPSSVGGQDPGQFVTLPFKMWFIAKVSAHATSDYHQNAMSTMRDFIARYENPSLSVATILDSQAKKTIDSNLKVIESLFKVAILCGKQGLAMRGHRDDRIQWEDEVEGPNEGNFIQLVRFRAETDEVLANHLSKCPGNACYTSKTIQNELLQVVGDMICSDILKEVKHARFYSIIADEVTDVSNKEELSLVIRYLHKEQTKEVFVDVIEVERITGQVLGETILNWLRSHNISPEDMRGQCYDGSSNMAGARAGVKSVVQRDAPKAMYVHCAAHRLNLCVVSACSIQAFKNAESYVGEIARFFSFSPKRQRLLEKAIETSSRTHKTRKLKDSCRTRWVERIDS